MENKYINESRYKKVTSRKRRDSLTVRNKVLANNQIKEKKSIKKTTKIKRNTRVVAKQDKVKNIIICVFLLLIIAVISRAILKEENEPFIPFPFFAESNDEIIKIGIITNESLLNSTTKNVVINELNKYSKDMLLEVNEDYTITYKCVSSITKVSNKEYILTINPESNVTANGIKEALDNYRTDKQSVYYSKLSNIESITVLNDNKLNVKLKTESPYFIYNLDINLTTSSDMTNYVQDASSTTNNLVLSRNKDADKSLPAKVVVIKYKDVYEAVQAYKEKKINMFVTNAENVMNILGRNEYNIKSYRNGKSVFLLYNPNSEICKRQEIRRAIAYSIDRDGIINDILKSKGNKIDLPYIYDNIKYKYDVYAAENILLTNGYKKVNNVYSKSENGLKIKLELTLLVNKQDELKVSIANKIKNNLNSIGIKVNVEKLSESKIQDRVKKGTYDLVIANIDLNNIPDISFIRNNLINTSPINQAIENIKNAEINNLSNTINNLQNVLSEQVAIIGLYCDISYLIYSKDIIGIDQISYMNLFKGILK